MIFKKFKQKKQNQLAINKKSDITTMEEDKHGWQWHSIICGEVP